jgi:hypothetical protein
MSRAALRRGVLWPLLALALVWAAVALAPLEPDELWWQLAHGRNIVATGALTTPQLPSSTLPSAARQQAEGWLGALLLYLTHELGGVPLLALLRGLLVTLAYGILARVAWERSDGHGPATAAAVVGAALLGAGGWALSGRTFGLPLLAGMLWALQRYLAGAGPRVLLLPPLLLALWANLGGDAIVGVVLTLALVLGALCELLRRHPERMPRARLSPLLLCALGTAAALLASPLGAAALGLASASLRPLGWGDLPLWEQPPAIATDLKGSAFFISLLLLLPLWRWRGGRARLPWLLALLALAWLAFDAWRLVTWYGLLFGLQLAEALGVMRIDSPRRHGEHGDLIIKLRVLRVSVVIVSLLLLLAGLPWLRVASAAPGERASADVAPAYPELLGRSTPVAAVEALRRLRAAGQDEGHLFHDVRYGSYLAWALPEEPTFIGPPLARFGEPLWEDYRTILRACDLELLFARYDIRRLLLDKRDQALLVETLRADDRWALAYEDSVAVLFSQR